MFDIKKILVKRIIKMAIKKHKDVEVSENQKRELENLTMLFVNKGISKELLELELNKVFEK